MFFHIPVAAIGIAGYLALGILALARWRVLHLAAAIVGLAFALHLTNIERNVLEVWCLYCVISQGIIALITVLSIIWLITDRVSRTRVSQAA
jgi:uncharacterized membrane protein